MLETTKAMRPTASNQLGRLAYSLSETALVLGISETSVRRLLSRKLIRASGALRHKVIAKAEVERFLRETAV
ncbi:MAG: hypothetical protein B9S33_17395 [Pedosphaera sp. Tous-C6FEB]|nr:MAG: hypothetical protein B9S33_17395 [Pedosphaera sp. Tous-C6FEB]